MSSTTAPIKLVDPPFYDAPIVDNPTAGQQHSQAWTEYHQAVADQVNALAAKVGAGAGVTDGSDAAAGQLGEYMTATASGIGLTNNVAANIVSLDLTAGDWDVSGNVAFSAGAGTHVVFAAGIDSLDTQTMASFPTGAVTQGISTSVKRYNGTATVTVWLVALAAFSGTTTASGTIRARRVR
jgi:hypothetical protein